MALSSTEIGPSAAHSSGSLATTVQRVRVDGKIPQVLVTVTGDVAHALAPLPTETTLQALATGAAAPSVETGGIAVGGFLVLDRPHDNPGLSWLLLLWGDSTSTVVDIRPTGALQ